MDQRLAQAASQAAQRRGKASHTATLMERLDGWVEERLLGGVCVCVCLCACAYLSAAIGALHGALPRGLTLSV